MLSFMFVFIAVGFGSTSAAAPTLGFGTATTPSAGEYKARIFHPRKTAAEFCHILIFTVNKSIKVKIYVISGLVLKGTWLSEK